MYLKKSIQNISRKRLRLGWKFGLMSNPKRCQSKIFILDESRWGNGIKYVSKRRLEVLQYMNFGNVKWIELNWIVHVIMDMMSTICSIFTAVCPISSDNSVNSSQLSPAHSLLPIQPISFSSCTHVLYFRILQETRGLWPIAICTRGEQLTSTHRVCRLTCDLHLS